MRESPQRFNFGSEQFRAFMERIGCHTLIRGHEQTDAGFTTVFDGRGDYTLFSAGGGDALIYQQRHYGPSSHGADRALRSPARC